MGRHTYLCTHWHTHVALARTHHPLHVTVTHSCLCTHRCEREHPRARMVSWGHTGHTHAHTHKHEKAHTHSPQGSPRASGHARLSLCRGAFSAPWDLPHRPDSRSREKPPHHVLSSRMLPMPGTYTQVPPASAHPPVLHEEPGRAPGASESLKMPAGHPGKLPGGGGTSAEPRG